MEPINSVCFLNAQGDLVVGHGGNISRLNAIHYVDKTLVVPDEELEAYLSEGVTLEETFFKEVSSKPVPPKIKALPSQSPTKIASTAKSRVASSPRKTDEQRTRPAVSPRLMPVVERSQQARASLQTKQSFQRVSNAPTTMHPTQLPTLDRSIGSKAEVVSSEHTSEMEE